VAFEGSIYRAPYPGVSPTTIDSFNIAANHRYSATGEGAFYFSTNSRTVIQELGGTTFVDRFKSCFRWVTAINLGTSERHDSRIKRTWKTLAVLVQLELNPRSKRQTLRSDHVAMDLLGRNDKT